MIRFDEFAPHITARSGDTTTEPKVATKDGGQKFFTAGASTTRVQLELLLPRSNALLGVLTKICVFGELIFWEGKAWTIGEYDFKYAEYFSATLVLIQHHMSPIDLWVEKVTGV